MLAGVELKVRQRAIDGLKRGRAGLVVSPSGTIRARTAEQFRQHVDAVLAEGADVTALVFDMDEVDSIDSSTAGYLLNVHDRLRDRGGNLALAGLRPGVRVVIDSIGLTTFFTVCETVDEALLQLG